MQVHLRALGCRLNEAELEQWARGFRAQGHGIVNSAALADVTIVNTCAVTAEATRKSRQLIRQLHRQNPAAKLVVSGCYASLQPDEAAALLGVDLVVGNADKERLIELSQAALGLPSTPMAATEPGANALFTRGRSRAFIKVQDGCRYRCTFCIVTVARGAERSRQIGEIVDEINLLHRQGVQEAVLTGVHLGGYGSDSGNNLLELLEAVLNDTAISRIRMGSLEPWDLPERFFSLFENPRLMPHLHLPLQSGSDAILRRMGRRCKTAEFSRLIERARAAIPDLNVTTDIIVGFPGETEQDWRQTLSFLETIGFGHLHIFPYSARAGTKAATLPEQVEKSLKKRRVHELHALARHMKRELLLEYSGRSAEVLLESSTAPDSSGRACYWGYTPNYLRVALDAQTDVQMVNSISPVCLTGVDRSGEFMWARCSDEQVA